MVGNAKQQTAFAYSILDRGQLDTLWAAPYTPPLVRQSSSCKLVLPIRLEKISAEGIIGELDAKS
jgi:hypothetical protein